MVGEKLTRVEEWWETKKTRSTVGLVEDFSELPAGHIWSVKTLLKMLIKVLAVIFHHFSPHNAFQTRSLTNLE